MQNSRKKINEKKLSKYVAAFDYFDKTLIFLSTASGRIYIFSFASIISAAVGIANECFSITFSLTTGIMKTLLKIKSNKKKKHSKSVEAN